VTQTALASVTSAKTRDSRSWHFPYKGDAGVLLIQCELCSRYWTEEVDGGYCVISKYRKLRETTEVAVSMGAIRDWTHNPPTMTQAPPPDSSNK